MLITNDGSLAHQLLSPKKHVKKTYFVRVEKPVSPEDVKMLEDGLDIGEEKKLCLRRFPTCLRGKPVFALP